MPVGVNFGSTGFPKQQLVGTGLVRQTLSPCQWRRTKRIAVRRSWPARP